MGYQDTKGALYRMEWCSYHAGSDFLLAASFYVDLDYVYIVFFETLFIPNVPCIWFPLEAWWVMEAHVLRLANRGGKCQKKSSRASGTDWNLLLAWMCPPPTLR